MTSEDPERRAAVIYANQLVPNGHGYPLWCPEPTLGRPVQVGDVGWFERGSFFTLFNAMSSPTCYANRRGVPEGFVPLHIDSEYFIDYQPNYIPEPGYICSNTVRRHEVSAALRAGDSVHTRMRFSCSRDQGAALIVHGGNAASKRLRAHMDVLPYIHKHHKSWHDLATKLKHDVRPEDIVFVTGTVKARAWVVAAFTGESSEQLLELGMSGGLASIGASAHFSKQNATSVEYRISVERDTRRRGEQTEEDLDQCLFVTRYKVKRREVIQRTFCRKLWASLWWFRGLGDRAISEQRKHTHNDDFAAQVSDTLEFVLEYILENSNCEVAIASDEIILALQKAGYDTGCTNVKKALSEMRHEIPLVVSSHGFGFLDTHDLPHAYKPNLDNYGDGGDASSSSTGPRVQGGSFMSKWPSVEAEPHSLTKLPRVHSTYTTPCQRLSTRRREDPFSYVAVV